MNIFKTFWLTVLMLSITTGAWAFPATYSNLEIYYIEMWPDAPTVQSSYTVKLKNNIQDSDGHNVCGNPNLLTVKAGADASFHAQTLSVLLAAQMAGKKINVRVSECTDRPVVDRVSITNN